MRLASIAPVLFDDARKKVWSPLNLSDLVLWLAADKITGLSDADPVVTWEDESGTGDDPTQGTADLRPTYQTGELNSLPVVRYDASNDRLVVALATDLVQPITQFGVVKIGADTATNRQIDGGDTGATRCVTFINGGNWELFAGTLLSGAAISADTWYYFIALFNGASSSLRVNGSEVLSGDAGAQDHGGYSIGSAFDGSAVWQSDFAEYGIQDGAISAGEITSLEAYIVDKYAL